MVPIAHATDGGSSIRVPAASCALFGLKPSFGRLPKGPDVDEVWAGLAVHGMRSRAVRDTASWLAAVHGPGVENPFHNAPPTQSYRSLLNREPGPLRVAL